MSRFMKLGMLHETEDVKGESVHTCWRPGLGGGQVVAGSRSRSSASCSSAMPARRSIGLRPVRGARAVRTRTPLTVQWIRPRFAQPRGPFNAASMAACEAGEAGLPSKCRVIKVLLCAMAARIASAPRSPMLL